MHQPDESLYQDHICILEEAEKGFQIGIIGTGVGFGSILELVSKPELEEFFPRLNLIALALAKSDDPKKVKRAQSMGARIYNDYNDMLARHPEINLVIELSDQLQLIKKLRQSLPSRISIIDHTGATFLCGMLIMAEVSDKCRINLFQQQAIFSALFDQIQDDILLLDIRGKVLDANQSVIRKLEKSKPDIVGSFCWEVFSDMMPASGCDLDTPDCPFRKTLSQKKPAESLQTWVDKHGRAHYYRIYTYPVFNEQGVLTKVVEMRRDITLRTEMEKRLQQSEKLAAVGELSTYIAHEIRNPLFAIGGFANSLLRKGELDEPSREKIKIILQESKRLDNILKNIINFSRPTQSEELDVNVNKVIMDIMQLFRMSCEEQSIKTEMELTPDLALAKGDPELIKQCLINLIKNSIEAMPDGGTLTMSTSMDQNFIVVRVKDTGQGIPKDIREKIFNPFFSTKKGAGAGLGLAMTKKIVEDMGGRLDLFTQEGRGTTVALHLPPSLAVEGGRT
ncbi:ATP-binding protein [Desulfonatronovibrio hydrogenovorans]|uniref:ATP-binding protein n=1 Tax=Desulfonatronovibrio hydrogenovorans TaxID=53245 RepID=UPI00048E362A|nr:ATP-binding protein [Desulfonatronovibrio hydrogenovorans]